MSDDWALSLVEPGYSVRIGTPEELGIVGLQGCVVEFWVKQAREDYWLPGIGDFACCLYGNGSLPADTWVHVAVRYQRGRSDRYYVNGALHFQYGYNGIGGNDLLFSEESAQEELFFWPPEKFRGHVTEYRIWTGDRTDAEIAAGVHRRVTGEEEHLLAGWPLRSPSGITPKGVHGPPLLLGGAARWEKTSRPPLLASDEPTPAEVPVLALRGGAYADLESQARGRSFPNGFTVEAWVEPHGQELGAVLSALGAGTGWELSCSENRAAIVVMADHSAYEVVGALPDRRAGDPQRVHLAGVYRGDHVELHINGQLAAVRSDTGGAELENSKGVQGEYRPSPLGLRIGQSAYSGLPVFTGAVTEVRIWDRARKQEEILATLFERLGTATTEGLLNYWPLDGRDSTSRVRLVQATWEGANLAPRLRSRLMPTQPDWQAKAQKLEEDVHGLEHRLANTSDSRAQAWKDREEALAKVQASTAQIATLHDEVETLRSAKIALEGQKEELEQQLEHATEGQVSLADLVRNTRRQIEKARGDISGAGGAYVLKEVNLEMHVVPGSQGDTVLLPEQNKLAELGGKGLSKVSWTFASKPVPKAMPKPVPVPNVVGLTEIVARRRLAEAGFRATAEIQALTTDHPHFDQVGRIVNQLPPAGTATSTERAVRIFVGQQAPGSSLPKSAQASLIVPPLDRKPESPQALRAMTPRRSSRSRPVARKAVASKPAAKKPATKKPAKNKSAAKKPAKRKSLKRKPATPKKI